MKLGYGVRVWYALLNTIAEGTFAATNLLGIGRVIEREESNA